MAGYRASGTRQLQGLSARMEMRQRPACSQSNRLFGIRQQVGVIVGIVVEASSHRKLPMRLRASRRSFVGGALRMK